MLAELGYTALAIDMYGNGKVAQEPKEAGELAQEIKGDPQKTKERFLSALEVLKNFHLTDPGQIAAIGYCFGGGVVLNMAMAGVDINGVVSFHGSLPIPAQEIKPGRIKARILVCHGGADQFAPPEQVAAFKHALDKAGADYQFIVYEGATHAFTNPDSDALAKKFNMPIAYNAAADQKSWEDMKRFLKNIFTGQGKAL